MKLSINKPGLESYNNLGTVVLYRERQFYPTLEKGETLSGELEKNFWSQISAHKVYFKTNLVSDLNDYASYEFKFNLDNYKDFNTFFLPSYLTSEEIKSLGSDTITQIANQISVQQISQNYDGKDKFYNCFGCTKGANTIGDLYLVPAEKGIWKAELYNETDLTSNIDFEQIERILPKGTYYNGFIDYDLMKPLGLIPTHRPFAQIYFGPMYDDKIINQGYNTLWPEQGQPNPPKEYNTYLIRYIEKPKESEYNSFHPTYENLKDYYEDYYTELSEKIIMIHCSDSVTEEDITIDLMDSLKSQKNPLRNTNKVYLRNDQLSKYTTPIVQSSFDIKKDISTGTFLGYNSIPDENLPILHSVDEMLKLDITPETKEVTISEKTYIKCDPTLSEKIEHPEISPNWIIKRPLTNNRYNKYYILSTGGGASVPMGRVLSKKGDDLNLCVKPEKGYYFDLDASGNPTREKEDNSGIYVKYQGLPDESKLTLNFKKASSKIFFVFDLPNIGNDLGESVGKPSQEDMIKALFGNLENTGISYIMSNTGQEKKYTGEKDIILPPNSDLVFYIDWDKSKYELITVDDHGLRNAGTPLNSITSTSLKYPLYTVTSESLAMSSNGTKDIVDTNILGTLKLKPIFVHVRAQGDIQCDTLDLQKSYGDELIVNFDSPSGREISVEIKTISGTILKPKTPENLEDYDYVVENNRISFIGKGKTLKETIYINLYYNNNENTQL